MGKKQEYEKIGQAGIYRPKPKPKTSFGDILGGIVGFFVLFAVFASCVG